jgi:hypothetical protein
MVFGTHDSEVLTLWRDLPANVFQRLLNECRTDLESIRLQFPSEDVVIDPVILNNVDGVRMLREDDRKMGDYDDLSTNRERHLRQILKEKYRVFHFEVSISAPRLDLRSKSQQILTRARARSIWDLEPAGRKSKSHAGRFF